MTKYLGVWGTDQIRVESPPRQSSTLHESGQYPMVVETSLAWKITKNPYPGVARSRDLWAAVSTA